MKKLALSPARQQYILTRLLFFAVAAAGIFLDQLTKRLAVAYLKGQAAVDLIPGVLRLRFITNTGAAFGSFTDKRWVFLTFSSVAIVLILLYVLLKKEIRPLFLIGLSFVFSGGIGNMIERIAQGYVVDFIDFYLIDFAVFNIADSFVTVGAVLLIIAELSEIAADRKQKNHDTDHR